MNVIETQELTKRYRGLTAIDAITFSVEQGQVFGFVGPNLGGKTARSSGYSLARTVPLRRGLRVISRLLSSWSSGMPDCTAAAYLRREAPLAGYRRSG